MTGSSVHLSARQVDALRRGVDTLEPDRAADLRAAGAIDEAGVVAPDVAAVLAVLRTSWASFRVRTWSAAGRVDLVGAVGPAGLALLSGPPDPDAPTTIDHRPRWTTAARVVAAFVGLAPSPRPDRAPSRASWSDLVAAALGPAEPDDLPPVERLWDATWTAATEPDHPRRLAVADLGEDGLVTLDPDRDEGDGMILTPCGPDEVWLGLGHALRASVTGPSPDGSDGSDADG